LAETQPTLSSMTGYGRAQTEGPRGQFTVELRSVNNRFLDVKISLPAGLQALEGDLRGLIRSRLRRGKIDCHVRFAPAAGEAVAGRLNAPLILGYLEELRTLKSRAGLNPEVNLETALLLPGAVEPAGEWARPEELWPTLAACAGSALDQLEAERRREGRELAAQILGDVVRLREACRAVAAAQPEVVARYRQKLKARLEELEAQTAVRLEPGRLEMETALLADRSDVSEEMTRLAAHLDRLEHLIHQESPEPAGKSLDFLIQELAREANTTAAKVRDLDLVNEALRMKGAIERIREQAQNVE